MKRSNTAYSVVEVPKNILLAVTDFTFHELSVIMALLPMIRSYMTMKYSDACITLDEIYISYRSFMRHNDRTHVYDILCGLRSKNIRYRIPIPGTEIEVTTGLFSSVSRDCRGGGVYVVIQREALPWLLALEKGYSPVEILTFFECRTLYLRRLYLYICSRMTNGNASFSVTMPELRDILLCPISDTPSMIYRRYLCGLSRIINGENTHSRYSMVIEPIYSSHAGAGRRHLNAFHIHFCAQNQKAKDAELLKIINIMQQYYDVIPRHTLRMFTDVVNDIYRAGLAETLTKLHDCYRDKYPDNMAHVANAVFLTLCSCHGIYVRKNAGREKNTKHK